jgi:hypothetical protein
LIDRRLDCRRRRVADSQPARLASVLKKPVQVANDAELGARLAAGARVAGTPRSPRLARRWLPAIR